MSQVVDRFYNMFHLIPSLRKEQRSSPVRIRKWELARLLKQELEESGAEQVRLE